MGEWGVTSCVSKPGKLLTDPYEASMRWAFGVDWEKLADHNYAAMRWEFRHPELPKLPDGKEAMRFIAHQWSMAVRDGRDTDMIIKDAIDKAAEAMRGQ